jgi:hypothetical protein
MNAYEKQQGTDVVLNGGLVVFGIAWMLFAAIGSHAPAVAPAAGPALDSSEQVLVPHDGSGAQPTQPLAAVRGLVHRAA